MSINQFNDDNGSFFVSVNDEEYSLWPTVADLPAGGRVVHGDAGRDERLNYIGQSWPDIGPKSLRVPLAATDN